MSETESFMTFVVNMGLQKYIVSSICRVGIRSIINLQLCGEHASCGPGLESSGFTYVPQEFMDQDGWEYLFITDIFLHCMKVSRLSCSYKMLMNRENRLLFH